MELNQTELNNKTWQITRKYAEAKRNGFLIEAMVLFNYMLRNKLIIIINNKLIQEKRFFKEQYLKKETNELANIAYNQEAISKNLKNDLNDYYKNYRSKIIHEMLTGEIDYDEIQTKMHLSLKIMQELQELIIGKLEGVKVNE